MPANNDVVWPVLQLTELEKRYCAHYRTDKKPGVRIRYYPVDLQWVQGVPGQESVLAGKYVPSGRYTRVFGICATGALPYFRIEVRTNSDEVLIEMANVATLFGLSGAGFAFAGAQTGFGLPQFNLIQQAAEPLKMEPNTVLPGATNILVNAEIEERFISTLAPDDRARAVLHLLFCVWEFPDVLEALEGPMRERVAK